MGANQFVFWGLPLPTGRCRYATGLAIRSAPRPTGVGSGLRPPLRSARPMPEKRKRLQYYSSRPSYKQSRGALLSRTPLLCWACKSTAAQGPFVTLQALQPLAFNPSAFFLCFRPPIFEGHRTVKHQMIGGRVRVYAIIPHAQELKLFARLQLPYVGLNINPVQNLQRIWV